MWLSPLVGGSFPLSGVLTSRPMMRLVSSRFLVSEMADMDIPPGNVGLPRDMLTAIGHVAAIWSHLEYKIDNIVRQALDLPDATEMDTALILPFGKRLALYADLLSNLGSEKQKEHIAELVAAIKPLKSRRDLIVHGSVGHMAGDRDGTPTYWFRRIRWDRPARILEKRELSVADVEAVALQISDLVAYTVMNDIILWPHQDASRDKGG